MSEDHNPTYQDRCKEDWRDLDRQRHFCNLPMFHQETHTCLCMQEAARSQEAGA